MSKTIAATAIAGFITLTASHAAASTFTLDFETLATGSNITTQPLATSLGTITASKVGGSLGIFGQGDNRLVHSRDSTDDYGQLVFSFDVSSIEIGDYQNDPGRALFEALDAGNNIVDSFLDEDSTTSEAPVTLSGASIRFLRFSDPGAATTSIDDVVITAATPIPLPGAGALLLGALGGLVLIRRREV